ncbi:MAG: hypothetical protein ABEK04_00865 [Candidatus Nanohalobium sp.]
MASFRTKRGRCILDEDKMYLTSSFKGHMKRLWEGNKVLLFGFSALYIWIGYAVVFGLDAAVLAGAGLGLVLVAISYITNHFRNFSSDSIIEKDNINSIKASKGSKTLTRPRFVVKFDKNGEEKNRYIMMPSLWLSYGSEEFEKAKEIFRDEGLELEEPEE